MIITSTDRLTRKETRVPERLSVDDLASSPELFAILVEHAYRGIRVQFLLRFFLVAFMIAAIAAVPPAHHQPACWVILAGYLAWSAGIALWARGGGVEPVRWMWVALVIDALALTALTVVAGESAEQSWTADLLINGFFILPMLAATQLRPTVCAIVASMATVAYFATSAATKAANTEPWGSIVVRTVALVGLSVGCIALSRVQLSRVQTIGGLAQNRTDLLEELLTLETRERTNLAEQLHDGALQFVLAARHDLEDARENGDPASFDRIDHALTESSGLLRSAVTQLHPAVLDQAGLGRALRDLATDIGSRADLLVEVDVDGWPEGTSTMDGLLYSCARELLTNVVKHAEATSVRVELSRSDERARLSIVDDGQGMAADAPATRLAQGHIGLASLRTRVAAAGGWLTMAGQPGTGTGVVIGLPYNRDPS
jgi:two-component system NarL family sensor kinase